MWDVIEESRDVSIDDPLEPVRMSGTDRLDSLMSIALRAEAKRKLRENRLEDGFKDGANHLLSNAVSDSGNAQRTKFTIPFRDEDPAEGGGAVAIIMLEMVHQGGKIVVQIDFKSANTDFIYPSRAMIAFNGKKSAVHPFDVY